MPMHVPKYHKVYGEVVKKVVQDSCCSVLYGSE